MMNDDKNSPKKIYLKDYSPSPFHIDQIDLIFEIDYLETTVTNTMNIRLDDLSIDFLFLNGENLELIDIFLDEQKLSDGKEYILSKNGIKINYKFNKNFILKIKNRIKPRENTDLQGLYISGDLLCTQNEPEGFRNITYFLDRPDCMSIYKTKIIGDKKRFPIMLSNGNKVDSGNLENGRHFVVWEDPSLKPSYLFALVAGKMGMIEDSFQTSNKNNVKLQIFCDLGNEDKCLFAMESLKKSMRWDEDTYGLVYDLDIYMIVAVDSFNFGAMENKGLNIFNSAYVLADSSSATDSDYNAIEGVIGHEYFHNWTGNRVTCRDWFQLTLKEGLTVFRDQSFSGDMNSNVVQRVLDVKRMKGGQFVEDSGPTSHPIKPKSYIEINNFYTHTVYEKGAEVIRMLHTLLGGGGFKKGMKLYFKRHDGQAVTTEDFVMAMSDANQFDLSQFSNWYHRSGTPEISFKDSYNKEKETLTIEITQNSPDKKNSEIEGNFYMPYRIGLLFEEESKSGFEINSKEFHLRDDIFIIKNKSQRIEFSNLKSKPILSLNRGFSAPVKTKYDVSDYDLSIILSKDDDLFNRYQASQDLALRAMNKGIDNCSSSTTIASEIHLSAIGKLLKNQEIDLSLKALSLNLPSINEISQFHNPIDYKKIHEVRNSLYLEIAKKYESQFFDEYQLMNQSKKYLFEKGDVAKREYKNILLKYLFLLKDDKYLDLVYDQYFQTNNMNDRFFAMGLIANICDSRRDEVLSHFYKEWKGSALTICKWFSVQSSSTAPDTFERILSLENDHVFDFKIPNHISALWGNLVRSNYIHFHQEDGRGYKFLKEKVLLMDKVNSRVASGLCNSFRDYKKLPKKQMDLMGIELESIRSSEGLSKDAFEIIDKILR